MRICPVDESAIGTLIARPIWEADGTLLLGVGERVTARIVHRLVTRGIRFIEVTDAFLPPLEPDGDVSATTRHAMHQLLTSTADALRHAAHLDTAPLAAVVDTMRGEIERQRGLLFSLSTLRETDEGTAEHAVRVGVLCALLAIELCLPPEATRRVALGGLLHDSGKAFLPRDVLLRPGALDATAWTTMRTHPLLGWNALRRAGVEADIAEVALRHHERLDGTGYPDRLAGDRIPLAARIAMVADMWDALVSERCYKPAWEPTEAAALLFRETREGKLDPRVTHALFARVAMYPVGSLVELGDGRLAQVVRQDASEPRRPLVLVVSDALGNPVQPFTARITQGSVQIRRIVRDLPAAVAAYLADHADLVREAVAAAQATAAVTPAQNAPFERPST